MARNITVSFGLLTVGMKSDKATITRPDMKNLCHGQPGHDEHPHQALVAPKMCPTCGEVTDYTVLDKGIKAGDTFTVVQQDAVAEAKETYAKEYKGNLNLIPHPAAEFLAATGPGESINYLTPADAASENHYALLVRLVQSHPELAFVSLHTPVSATSLYHLTVREGVLVMEQRVREQAMKPVPSVGGVVNDQLYTMLEGILPSFQTAYSPDDYEDKYLTAIDALVADGVAIQTTTEEKPVRTTDDSVLIEQLKKLQAAS